MVEYGWDKQYRGIFYFMDRLGYPTQQLEWDQKLWWVHIETLITMIKGYQLTGSKESLVVRENSSNIHGSILKIKNMASGLVILIVRGKYCYP